MNKDSIGFAPGYTVDYLIRTLADISDPANTQMQMDYWCHVYTLDSDPLVSSRSFLCINGNVYKRLL